MYIDVTSLLAVLLYNGKFDSVNVYQIGTQMKLVIIIEVTYSNKAVRLDYISIGTVIL